MGELTRTQSARQHILEIQESDRMVRGERIAPGDTIQSSPYSRGGIEYEVVDQATHAETKAALDDPNTRVYRTNQVNTYVTRTEYLRMDCPNSSLESGTTQLEFTWHGANPQNIMIGRDQVTLQPGVMFTIDVEIL